MECLAQKTLLDLPDETIEHILAYLSFADLSSLSKAGNRLESCAKRVSKFKPFCKYNIKLIIQKDHLISSTLLKISFVPNSFSKIFLDIVIIGGFGNGENNFGFVALDDVEMISIVNDSVVHAKTAIPSLPKQISTLTGGQLPNGNLLVRGMSGSCVEYLLFRDGSNQWTKIRSSEWAFYSPSSVLIDGRFFTTGFGNFSSGYKASYHEEFTLNGSVEERRKLPIGLQNRTATIFGKQKILLCGGFEIDVSNRFLNHKTN